ncbi:TetR/AcrR family transcriptional regulator [Paenibacillus sp. Marseille-Q4541]|uniref:TetR/AcrR family transcriptional regulator n=1 Tax=Paenibacillus sp. Marseille-Q4541 TaxID=2831522 RepID=UPI001BAC234F|nr:TetR/AcrR family transcriptional regulator [Paenibacillus sp. Marseille-Q4541]
MNSITDKKKHILVTALGLFSTKGTSATSMQEIAEVCGISKGSLYLHFKSKEELQRSVINYCIHSIYDKIVLVESEQELSPKDKLRKQFKILLENFLELKEFFLAQLQDAISQGNSGLTMENCPEGMLALTMKQFNQKMIDVYGPEIHPYTLDLALQVHSMMGAYIRIIVSEILPMRIERMAEYLVETLDDLAEAKLRLEREPFIPQKLWLTWMEEGIPKGPSKKHPFLLLKEMRQRIEENTELSDRVRTEALESILVMEHELTEINPRRVILTGMLSNLSAVPGTEEQVGQLSHLFETYLSWRE